MYSPGRNELRERNAGGWRLVALWALLAAWALVAIAPPSPFAVLPVAFAQEDDEKKSKDKQKDDKSDDDAQADDDDDAAADAEGPDADSAADDPNFTLRDEVEHDLLFLTTSKNPLKIKALPFRKSPEKVKPTDKVAFTKLENDVEYEVPWRYVDHVEFFEDRILAEAVKAIADGDLDRALERRRMNQRGPIREFLAAR